MRRMIACVAWLALLLFGAVPVSSAHIPCSTASYHTDFEDAFKANLISKAGEKSFEFIGHELDKPEYQGMNLPPKVVLHGLVGGALSELSGGDFTSGAIATATSHIVAEHVKDHYYKQAIRGEISVEELKGKVLAISGMVGGAAAIAMNPDITPEELNTARTMSESVAEHNSLKLVISAVKVVKKLAQVKGKLSKEKVVKAFKDEGLDIIDDLHTLADDEVNMDDVLALADLAIGTNLSNKQMRAARNAVDKKNVANAKQKVDASGGSVVAKGVTNRPSSFRKKTVQDSWDNAADGSKSGTKACPTCGKDVEVAPGQGRRDWDVDHQPKWKDRDLGGMDRKQVLDEYNKDVRLRCPGCNRSDN